jgi:general nucleoside transport system ATP-binding protein
VGENGAGKTSLMNVLYGLYQPDSGEVWIRGERVRLRTPKDAIARGVGMVHQHFMLVPPLTVAENVVLGREPRRRGLLDVDAACEQVAQTCRRFGFSLDPRARIEDLSVGSQQKVEIVKALHRGAQVLILDEPTAVLTPQEADELFAVTRGLAETGHTIVFISHKLREVLQLASRVVVMRQGRKVAEVPAEDATAESLAALMIGERTSAATVGGRNPAPPGAAAKGLGEAFVSLRRATALGDNGREALRGVSIDVFPGEILGIAGVDGNGQRELAEVLTGLRPLSGGELTVGSRDATRSTPGELRALGVAHVPEDRLRCAIVGAMTVEENAALGRQAQAPFARGPWIDFAGRNARARALLAEYDVRPPDPSLRIGELSGGNQQKLVVARELDQSPRLIVIVQPTRGLDIAAVASVHARIREARDRGAAVVLVSLDLEELFALSDRLYVLFGGQVVGERQRGELDERAVGALMLGAARA